VNEFSKFFHCQIPEEMLYRYIIKIVHLTLNMFLQYLVKVGNHNCCPFQWPVACETSEFILQDIRLH